MKVKVRDKVYDGSKEPVMVILDPGEKQQISNMAPEATRYCVYPGDDEWLKDDYKLIKEWMENI